MDNIKTGEKKLTAEDCVQLLKQMQSSLEQKEEKRFPRRSDFSDEQVAAIKAFLGPWPRALEAAGLKPAREGQAEKNREKRIRAKRRRRQAAE